MSRFVSLRLLLPLIIALLLIVSIGISFYISRHLVINEIVSQLTTNASERMNFLQGVMGHFLRYDEIENISEMVASIATEQDLHYISVVTKDGDIVASSRFEDVGDSWDNLLNRYDKDSVQKIIETQSVLTRYDQQLNIINAYASLCVQKIRNVLRSDDCGFILYQVDLLYHLKKSEKSIFRGFIVSGSVLFVGSLVLILIIKNLITRRIAIMVNTLKVYEDGDHKMRINVKGRDELAWLSESINHMLNKIDENHADIIEREERMESLFQTVIDAIIIIDNKGIIHRVNKAAEKLFGYSHDEMVGRNVSIIMPEPYQSEHDQYLKNYKETGVRKVIGISREVKALKRDGSIFPADISITEMQVSGKTMYSGIVHDITERKEFERAMQQVNEQLIDTNRKLNELATVDSLTNIYNRRIFDERIIDELNRSTRDKLPLTLLICDIDYFKLFNDTYGHQAGDDCLYKVATVIKTFFQRGGEMVARYGGEEFVVILPNTDTERAKWLSEMLIRAIHEMNIPHGQSKASDRVTISIGVGTYMSFGKVPPSADQIIRIADQGLYKAKANGRDRVEIGEIIN